MILHFRSPNNYSIIWTGYSKIRFVTKILIGMYHHIVSIVFVQPSIPHLVYRVYTANYLALQSFCFGFKLCTWCYNLIKAVHIFWIFFIFCSWQVAWLGILIKYKRHAEFRLQVPSPKCGISSWNLYISQFVLLIKNAYMISRFVL